jgi:hypothetical protein
VAWGEVAVGLIVGVWVCDVSGFVAERGEERGILLGVMVSEWGCDGIGEYEGGGLVDHSAGATLSTEKASEGRRGVATGHDGLC